MNEEELTPRQEFERKRTFAVNNLDSAWLSAEPDYTNVQNTYADIGLSRVFSLFNSGIRLSKITSEQAKMCQYDLVTAADVLDLGLYDFALSVFFDVASLVETSQSVKGFRTDAMNKITQEIKQIQEQQKPNVFGGKKNDE